MVVCGKGHEKSMNVDGVEKKWSDLNVIRNLKIMERKKVAVLGLGVEGKDLVNFLLSQKKKVTVLDKADKDKLDTSGIDSKKIEFICGEDYLDRDLDSYETIYRSPGVYRYLSQLLKVEQEGIEISSAMKLFLELCPAKIIGVTGTKGKGTTSTLIYEILKASGKRVFLAGNIGKPYLALGIVTGKQIGRAHV